MGTWALIQVVFNIFAALGFFVIIMRMNRAPKDDPRLSRGLQLLQSKISVLEDLSDRTEMQVNQLTSILDQKVKEVQAKVQLADQHVQAIRVSMDRSLEVAKIFQDKIPHQEIIERQNTIKYVQAARLAHQGLSVDEIAAQVSLPKGEIEFIAKVNRDRLMFNEESLPAWAKEESSAAAGVEATDATLPQAELGHLAFEEPQDDPLMAELGEKQRLVENLSRLQTEMYNLDRQLARESSARDLSAAFEVPRVETNNMKKLGEEFRKACQDAEQKQSRSSLFPPLEQLTALIPQIFNEGAEQGEKSSVVPAFVEAAPTVKASDKAEIEKVEITEETNPETIRAAARAKVQAALQRSKPAAAEASPVSEDLQAARALAKGVEKETSPAIRPVQFPKIDAP